MEKKALGRGLEALLPATESGKVEQFQGVIEIDVEHLLPSRYQPRQGFPEAELEELADSIKQAGLSSRSSRVARGMGSTS